jgi:hypothetical protein
MEYLLFIHNDPTAPPYVPAEDNIEEWVAEMDRRGVRAHGDRLRPAEDATTVAVRDGELIVSDGPFAETKDVLVCDDLDAAIEIASLHPMARFGSIEIRPIWSN